MSQEKEKEEDPRIPGAFRPGDPIPEQPKPKTVDEEEDHDKAREREQHGATAVDPMKSSDGNDPHRGKPSEGGHHKAR